MVFKANSEGEKVLSTMLFSPEWVFRSRVLEQYLHYKLRGWRKVFTTNLMSVDLLQNTPKTRKPIAERTSHKWHGYTTRGCSSLCCTKQLQLLPRMVRIGTDGWGALFSHRIWQRGYGRDAIPS